MQSTPNTVERGKALSVGAVLALLGAVAFFVSSSVLPATAQTPTDSDEDGFSNAHETSGFALAPNVQLIKSDGTLATFIPACTSSIPRRDCVDASTPDLFVMIVPTPQGSLLTSLGIVDDVLSFVTSGLGITVHRITPTLDRVVAPSSVSTQKAIKLTESLTISPNLIGSCQWGTPNGLDGCIVYTAAIQAAVTPTCPATCTLSNGVAATAGKTAADVIKAYIRHAFAHEAGHSTARTGLYNTRTSGYHDKAGTYFVMEEYEIYTQKGGNTTWYIADRFTDADRTGFVLSP